jgi:short-subunit dehydrogenase
MFSYAGKTALITCATSGIGEAFAQILAARGMNLVLVARSADKLRALAQDLSGQHGIRAEVVPADLCRADAAQEVYRRTQELGVAVDLLVNNAGFGTFGRFDTLDPEWEHEEIMLNVTALVGLTHAFLPATVEGCVAKIFKPIQSERVIAAETNSSRENEYDFTRFTFVLL